MIRFILAATALIPIFSVADFAPQSGQAIAFQVSITSGTGYLASSGDAVLFSHPDTADFILLGDNDIANGYGSYTWQKTGPNTAALTVNDLASGVTLTYYATFTSKDGGNFMANAKGVGTQSGTFILRYMLKASEVSKTLAAGKPVLSVNGNTAEINFQVKKSDNLEQWETVQGAVSSTDGTITVSTPMASTNKFFRLEMLTE